MGKFRKTIHFIIFIKLFFINYPYLRAEDEENCCITICPCFRNFKDKLEKEKEELKEEKEKLQIKENELKQREENLEVERGKLEGKSKEIEEKKGNLNDREIVLNEKKTNLKRKGKS